MLATPAILTSVSEEIKSHHEYKLITPVKNIDIEIIGEGMLDTKQ